MTAVVVVKHTTAHARSAVTAKSKASVADTTQSAVAIPATTHGSTCAVMGKSCRRSMVTSPTAVGSTSIHRNLRYAVASISDLNKVRSFGKSNW